VLGASEPWVSKRRGSESKLTGPNLRDPANGHVEKSSDIKEEAEGIPNSDPADKLGAPEDASAPTDATFQRFQAGHANIPNQFIDNTGPIATNGSNPTMALAEEPTKHPSLVDNADLASIEWSYLDVQGQVQGSPLRFRPRYI